MHRHGDTHVVHRRGGFAKLRKTIAPVCENRLSAKSSKPNGNLTVLTEKLENFARICRYVFVARAAGRRLFRDGPLRHGARFSGANLKRYPHADMVQADARCAEAKTDTLFLVSDGVFSMDGDAADLPALHAMLAVAGDNP